MTRLWPALGVALVILLVGASSVGSATGRARPVVIVPVGAVPASTIQRAASTLRTELGLRVRVAPRLRLSSGVLDTKRGQLIANIILEDVKRTVPAASDGRTAVIALTVEDMYPVRTGWKWSFAFRQGIVGVVSLARMDQTRFELEPDPGLTARRTHKYVIRYGALLALGHAETSDPRSLLYDSIVSVDDLDFMEPEYPTPPLTDARRQWLRTTEVACHAAGGSWEAALGSLGTATTDQVPALLGRWADADDELAVHVLPHAAGAPEARALVVASALRKRASFLRSLRGAPLPLAEGQVKHLRSLSSSIRAGMLEIGSKTCASETV